MITVIITLKYIIFNKIIFKYSLFGGQITIISDKIVNLFNFSQPTLIR